MDLAIMLLDNIVCYRHAQAGSFTHILGGKEWFEDFLLCIFIHACTVISYVNKDAVLVATGIYLQRACSFFAMLLVYRMDRVGNDIQEYLVELSGIALDLRNRTVFFNQFYAVCKKIVHQDERRIEAIVDVSLLQVIFIYP